MALDERPAIAIQYWKYRARNVKVGRGQRPKKNALSLKSQQHNKNNYNHHIDKIHAF